MKFQGRLLFTIATVLFSAGLCLAQEKTEPASFRGSQFEGQAAPPPDPYRTIAPPPLAVKAQDLIQIVVDEKSRASVDSRMDSSRKTEISMLIDQFVKITSMRNLTPDFGAQPNIEMEAENRTRSIGKANRRDSLQTTVMAKVTEVLPNGNIRIEARRERTVSGETTIVTLSGEAPPEAVRIDPDTGLKVIQGEFLADFKINLSGAGPITRRTGDSWFGKVVDFIWPF